ncbi:hypothetical protein EST38_g6871 [Candolleomyces aberdarensis]|uniref:Protein farnesyltransferase/geranylgeranyltransferase type-1 subunit alpha n=1 Tax=Candolleomyces aberdarensis TaxID=2316362 RepID=A0A4Q2DGT1_9AGAR|nr:hypothetical protein EST38_g6871 [Candolleomyces aberdarensis]
MSEGRATLFADREEWKDVEPLEQYENLNPLAPILYTPEYKDATGYFRAIAKSGEKSPRVLVLTEAIIRMNPGHYSAWQYRYETLLAIDAPLDVELKLMNEFAVKYLKSYQVWHHRRLLVTIMRKPIPELAFITLSLSEDSKNYHTWSYRQWLLAYFNDEEDLWAKELDFVERMLAQDIRNNSAWHHRFFVVWASGVRDGEEDRERVLKRELTQQSISLAPNNASAWNYLRGILNHNKVAFSSVAEFVKLYTVPYDASRKDIVDVDLPPPGPSADLPCAAAIEFLADVYEQEGDKDGVQRATELWKSLATEHDTIRVKYWEHRIREALESVQS